MIKYDKVNDDVAFIEDTHKYFNIKDPSMKYVSVTTLIGKYHEEFDEDFWSSYKAIERLTGKDFIEFGVKKTLLSNNRIPKTLVSDLGLDANSFLEVKNEILEGYEKARIDGCERGTRIHKIKEESFYENTHCCVKKLTGNTTPFYCKKNDFDLQREQAVYPEILIYYHHYRGFFNIAGQVDLLVKDGNDIYIYDFKTNVKGIKDKAFFDTKTKQTKKMLHPLSHIEDTVLMHYTLQLSLYAFMLQESHPEFNIKVLKLIHIDKDNNESEIELEYKKEDVKKLIEYHSKRIKKEYEINKINFDFLNNDGEW